MLLYIAITVTRVPSLQNVLSFEGNRKDFISTKLVLQTKIFYVHCWLTKEELFIRNFLWTIQHLKAAMCMVSGVLNSCTKGSKTYIQSSIKGKQRQILNASWHLLCNSFVSLDHNHFSDSKWTGKIRVAVKCRMQAVSHNKHITVNANCTAPYVTSLLCLVLLDTYILGVWGIIVLPRPQPVQR